MGVLAAHLAACDLSYLGPGREGGDAMGPADAQPGVDANGSVDAKGGDARGGSDAKGASDAKGGTDAKSGSDAKGGVVAFDGQMSHADNYSAVANVVTVMHTVPAGSDRLLAVAVGSWTASNPTTFTITYAGFPFTRQIASARYGTLDVGDDEADLWTLVDPPVGTASLVIAVMTASAMPEWGFVASGWTGVDQASPIRNTGDDSFGGNGPHLFAITLLCTSGDAMVDALDDYGTPGTPSDPTIGAAPQTRLYSRTDEGMGSEIADSSYEACSGSEVTTTWDLSDDSDSSGPYVAMVLRQAGGP